MIYNFDEHIERLGTCCSKWDGLANRFGASDLLALWVADMDWPCAEPIQRAIRERAAHPVFGYPMRPDNYYDSFIAWEKKHNDWDVKREWCNQVPGVVCGLASALMSFTAPGDGVLVMPPCYHPFRNTVNAQGRRVVNSPLVLKNGRYEIDFADLAHKAKECRVLLLCNPHNPSGRCFTRDELLGIEKICRENELIVISDEIHSDIVFKPHRHLPFASISDWSAQHSVTLMAPSKTFNIAGLVASVYIVPNPNLRKEVARMVGGWMHVSGGNIFGQAGFAAAYAEGEEWYQQMMDYLQGNVDFLDAELKARVPAVKLIRPEATYIPLIDCRELNLTNDKLEQFMIRDVKAGLNEGWLFGTEGSGMMRINLGTPRANLKEFVDRLEKAVVTLRK